jgi:hypothetical protein
VGEACGSSRRGELRGRVRARAAIRELVVTADPLVVRMLREIEVILCLRRISDSVLAEGSGGRV